MKLPINRLPSASEVSPGAGPTPTNRLAAEMFHKKGFIAKLQERRFISRRHGVPSSSRGQARQHLRTPAPPPPPLKAGFLLGTQAAKAWGPHRNQWH